MHERINDFLNEMQAESPNCGGKYHFTKLLLPAGNAIGERLKKYLLCFPAYQKPFVEMNGEQKLVEDRKVENLKLIPVPDYQNLTNKLLKYWREHRTSLDCREDLSDQYSEKETTFKNSLFDFVSGLSDLTIYELQGIDTYFTSEIGGDMTGNDILFVSSDGIFVLHFGWSS